MTIPKQIFDYTQQLSQRYCINTECHQQPRIIELSTGNKTLSESINQELQRPPLARYQWKAFTRFELLTGWAWNEFISQLINLEYTYKNYGDICPEQLSMIQLVDPLVGLTPLQVAENYGITISPEDSEDSYLIVPRDDYSLAIYGVLCEIYPEILTEPRPTPENIDNDLFGYVPVDPEKMALLKKVQVMNQREQLSELKQAKAQGRDIHSLREAQKKRGLWGSSSKSDSNADSKLSEVLEEIESLLSE
ncbi:hypothetical protein [Vibrio sinaloensis]|uniref:hypothetical protein n=1 Tax=Photobacterium sp. (strain ATCC 43367) TaxID=379097 RepID=UPI0022AFCB8A|nr:hypothetical protein [Vibrio sinaloensis]MCZ4295115.1 hypothetical protein [Vibrio sinaloensis]